MQGIDLLIILMTLCGHYGPKGGMMLEIWCLPNGEKGVIKKVVVMTLLKQVNLFIKLNYSRSR